jgi:hypothetical protein
MPRQDCSLARLAASQRGGRKGEKEIEVNSHRNDRLRLSHPHGWHATLCVVCGNCFGILPTLTVVDCPPRFAVEPSDCSPLEGDCRPPRRQTVSRTREGPVFLSLRLRPPDRYADVRAGVGGVSSGAAIE